MINDTNINYVTYKYLQKKDKTIKDKEPTEKSNEDSSYLDEMDPKNRKKLQKVEKMMIVS